MTDWRPERVYGIMVRPGRVFLRECGGGRLGLPGGEFRPLAENRKAELAAHVFDQVGVTARAIWAQGAFDYRDAADDGEAFSGFYTVWEWDGEVPETAGRWLDETEVLASALPPSLRILLLSVLETQALRTR